MKIRFVSSGILSIALIAFAFHVSLAQQPKERVIKQIPAGSS